LDALGRCCARRAGLWPALRSRCCTTVLLSIRRHACGATFGSSLICDRVAAVSGHTIACHWSGFSAQNVLLPAAQGGHERYSCRLRTAVAV